MRRLAVSPRAAERLAEARRWLGARGAAERVMVVAATLEAGTRLLREALPGRAVFGWQRLTLRTLAGQLAAASDRAPAFGLALEAVAARAVHRVRETNARALGRFAAIADRPGFPRALAATFGDLSLSGFAAEREAPGLDSDLAALRAAYAEELASVGAEEASAVLERAAAVAREVALPHPLVGVPLLLLDVPVGWAVEAALVEAVAGRAPEVLATAPEGDERAIAALARALGAAPSRGERDAAASGRLLRLQADLFAIDAEALSRGERDVAAAGRLSGLQAEPFAIDAGAAAGAAKESSSIEPASSGGDRAIHSPLALDEPSSAGAPMGPFGDRTEGARVSPPEPGSTRTAMGPFGDGAAGERAFASAPDAAGASNGTASLGDDVVVFSAPGEGRECVEIARRVLVEARRGVPFDRMAVLPRSPEAYRAPLEEAFRRAGIPAWFTRAAARPDPSGRALLALLACAAEGLSARGFAEYLSLSVVPDAPGGVVTAAGDATTTSPLPASATASGERAPWAPPADEIVAPRLRDRDGSDSTESDDVDEADLAAHAAGPAASATAIAAAPLDAARVVGGSLRVPRRWERLLVDAAVIGGRARWERRLDGLARELEAQKRALEPGDSTAAAIDRRLAELATLRAFALPLLDELAALPERAVWGTWLEALGHLARRALREPTRVLAVLAELAPLAPIGPVDLDEVQAVLTKRLSELPVPSTGSPAGRVFVGSPAEARGLVFDVVFVPGLAERMFPQKVLEDPLLPDAARARLDSAMPARGARIAEERLALRLAVGAAARRVVLSYPRMDVDRARPRVPSFYALEALRAAEGRLPAFEELARLANEAAPSRMGWPAPRDASLAIDDAEYDLAVLATLLEGPDSAVRGAARYLLESPHLARALRFRARRWDVQRFTHADGLVEPTLPEARAALASFGLGEHAFAPTVLESFAVCPYRFYLRAIVRLAPREVPAWIDEMDARARGRLVHDVQRAFVRALSARGELPVTPGRLDAALATLDGLLDAIAARYRDDLAPAIDRVFDDGVEAVRADLRQWVRRMAGDATWVPVHAELGFGLPHDPERDPASVSEPVAIEGGMLLRGSIDLVERRGDLLRATDHKTGAVRVDKGIRIAGGRVLQPVLYALALERLFPERTVDSGRLYYATAAGGFHEHVVPLDEPARQGARLVAETIGGAIAHAFLPAAPEKGACASCDYVAVCGPSEELRVARKRPRKEGHGGDERLVPLERLRGAR